MRRIAAAIAATALALTLAGALTLGGGSIAGADSRPASPRRAGAADQKARPLLRNAIHGELLVTTDSGGTETVEFDRGTITAISGDEISLQRQDGVDVTQGLTSSTIFNGMPRDELVAGTPAIVVSQGGDAVRVVTRGDGRAGRQALKNGCANAQRPAVKRLCQRAAQRSDRGNAGQGDRAPALEEGFLD
jgi:hypothetical protein